jgi:signal transduction histidine kinase
MLATDQTPKAGALSPTAISFIELQSDILARWEGEVRVRVSGAHNLLSPALINTIPLFVANIAEALSPDYPRPTAVSDNNAASAHGGERARLTDFGPDQVIEEYQILRESIAYVANGRISLSPDDWRIIDESINKAIVEAVRAFMAIQDGARKQVAASLSHDMRTPLSVIANGASVIGLSRDPAAMRRVATRIEDNANRLSAMVGELVDALTGLAHSDRSLHVEEFDLTALARSVAQEFNDGGIGQFKMEGQPVRGYWCQNALRRALENLASNAHKYGDGRLIRIKTEQAYGRVALTVRNFGNPIPKERQDEIFEYLRRDAGSSSETGWGIGLGLVKKVAERHGGSVAVDSSQELGTTFIIDLPVDSRPYAAASSIRAIAGGSSDAPGC